MKALIILTVLLTGCDVIPLESDARAKNAIRFSALKVGVENCLAKKGTPVFSYWDGRMLECKP